VNEHGSEKHRSRFWFLTLGCIGVVYGDIGTSPLYAFREAAMHATVDGIIQANEIYSLLSLILWALIVVVTCKYILFLLRANNRGEGGILSLMALAQKAAGRKPGFFFMLGLIGAALFYGDAAITPAISVMSAIEGLKLVTPAFDKVVLLISVLILFLLFSFQKRGTQNISVLFGPIMTIWFLAIGLAGIGGILQNPSVIVAFNPLYAITFIMTHGVVSLVVLGSVFLAVTGAETLYADLGHFGRKPIQTAWLILVFPCLTLNYMGQAAAVLVNHAAADNPFYMMLPQWALLPMVGLASVATITASQAVITGTFSLTRQAIQLGLLPRMEIRHTSERQHGQIFLPKINRMLLIAVTFLCLLFGSSSALASAYGIAVSGTMLVTTCFVSSVIYKVWKRSLAFTICLVLPFFCIEIVFFIANLLKIFDGGYVPLMLAGFLVLLMYTWVAGTNYLRRKDHRRAISLTDLMEKLDRNPPTRVPGTALFLTSNAHDAPMALIQNLKHNKVLHTHNYVMTIVTTETPKVPDNQRMQIEIISSSITRMVVSFGYMETPDVPRALILARQQGIDINIGETSFFLGKRSIISDAKRGLPEWQDHIYIAMAKSAASATDFYRIPYNQVVEMGTQIAV